MKKLANIKLKDLVLENTDQINLSAAVYCAATEKTQIEVFPTTVEIPAGTADTHEALSGVFGQDTAKLAASHFTGLVYENAVPACSKLFLFMYISNPLSNTKARIDFGDGTIIDLSSYQFTGEYENQKYFADGYYESALCVTHDYAGEETNCKQIVTVWGDDVSLIRGDYTLKTGANLLSRILGGDLAFSDKLFNVSSMFNKSLRILELMVPDYKNMNALNFSGFCQSAQNLKRVVVNRFTNMRAVNSVANMFENCRSLEQSNWPIPGYVMETPGASNVYRNCVKLSSDISGLLPYVGPSQTPWIAPWAFNNCSCLTGTVPEWLKSDSIAKTYSVDNPNKVVGYLPFQQLSGVAYLYDLWRIAKTEADLPGISSGIVVDDAATSSQIPASGYFCWRGANDASLGSQQLRYAGIYEAAADGVYHDTGCTLGSATHNDDRTQTVVYAASSIDRNGDSFEAGHVYMLLRNDSTKKLFWHSAQLSDQPYICKERHANNLGSGQDNCIYKLNPDTLEPELFSNETARKDQICVAACDLLGGKIKAHQYFKGCRHYANKVYWFENYSDDAGNMPMFGGCAEAILAQVPRHHGGRMPNS